MSESSDLVDKVVKNFVELVEKGGAFQDRRIFPLNYNNLRVAIVNNLAPEYTTQQVTYLNAMQILRETYGGSFGTYLTFEEAVQVLGYIKNPESRTRGLTALVRLHAIHQFKTPKHFKITMVNGTIVSTGDYNK